MIDRLEVVEGQDHSLEILYRWYHPSQIVFFLVFSLWTGLVLWKTYTESESVGEMIFDGWLGVVVVGYFVYISLAGLCNKTRLTVAGGQLSVKHFPLPWSPGRQFPVSHIKQLYVQRKSRALLRMPPVFNLCALLADGQKLKLIGGRASDTELLAMERVIEDRLSIVDQAMSEEY